MDTTRMAVFPRPDVSGRKQSAGARTRPASAGCSPTLAAGDRRAAERLVERTYRGVYAFLRRLCGDPDLAADLTQETYRKAWDGPRRASTAGRSSRPGSAASPTPPSSTTCAGPAASCRSKRGTRRRCPTPRPRADETVGPGRWPASRLRRAVLALPEELRFTVTALFWGELPVKEVARHEGVTPWPSASA